MSQNNQIYNGTASGAMVYRDPYAEQQQNAPQLQAAQPQPSSPEKPNRTPIIIGAASAAVVIIGLIIALIVVVNKNKAEVPSETASERQTEEATEEESTSLFAQPVHVDGLSDDWLSEQVAIDGKVYHLPFAYSEISDKYTFDVTDNEFVESEIIKPNDKISCVVPMESPSVDEKFIFRAGFMNTSSEDKNIKDTDIWNFDMDITWAKSGNYPTVVLPKGITWNCSLDDVIAAYGKPSHTYRSDINGYWEYTYEDTDYDYSLRMTFYDEQGLTAISVHSFTAD